MANPILGPIPFAIPRSTQAAPNAPSLDSIIASLALHPAPVPAPIAPAPISPLPIHGFNPMTVAPPVNPMLLPNPFGPMPVMTQFPALPVVPMQMASEAPFRPPKFEYPSEVNEFDEEVVTGTTIPIMSTVDGVKHIIHPISGAKVPIFSKEGEDARYMRVIQRLIDGKSNYKYPMGLEEHVERYSWKESGEYQSDYVNYILNCDARFPEFAQQCFGHYRLEEPKETDCEAMLSKDPSVHQQLLNHQNFAPAYLHPATPYRALLAFYGLGAGKTRIAIETAKPYYAIDAPVIFLGPAALSKNFETEVTKWEPESQNGIFSRTHMVNYNGKPIDSFTKLATKMSPNWELKKINDMMVPVIRGALIIIEEAHNVSRLINNGGRTGQFFKALFENAQNIKILALTGTPISNHENEVVALFNLLRGPMYDSNGKVFYAFKSKEDFSERYVQSDTYHLKNEQQLKGRITGIVSYYGGVAEVIPGSIYPVMVSKVVKVYMGPHQLSRYSKAVESEEKAKEKKILRKEDEPDPRFYKVQSRMMSNFGLPGNITTALKTRSIEPKNKLENTTIERLIAEAAELQLLEHALHTRSLDQAKIDRLGDLRESVLLQQFISFSALANSVRKKQKPIETVRDYHTEVKKMVNREPQTMIRYDGMFVEAMVQKKVDPNMLSRQILQFLLERGTLFSNRNLASLSPKMLETYRILSRAPGSNRPIFVYSAWRALYGMGIFEVLLRHQGYTRLNASREMPNTKGLRYAIISGSETEGDREIIRNYMNEPRNKNGEYLKVLMGTAAAAEGITLHYIGQVIILEPFWNESRIEQVVGRARRICSHSLLPKDERVVYVYKMLSIDRKEDSTDLYLFERSAQKYQTSQAFITLFKESAADCFLNVEHNKFHEDTLELACTRYDRSEDLEENVHTYTYLPDSNTPVRLIEPPSSRTVVPKVFRFGHPSQIMDRDKYKYHTLYIYEDEVLKLRSERRFVNGKPLTLIPLYEMQYPEIDSTASAYAWMPNVTTTDGVIQKVIILLKSMVGKLEHEPVKETAHETIVDHTRGAPRTVSDDMAATTMDPAAHIPVAPSIPFATEFKTPVPASFVIPPIPPVTGTNATPVLF